VTASASDFAPRARAISWTVWPKAFWYALSRSAVTPTAAVSAVLTLARPTTTTSTDFGRDLLRVRVGLIRVTGPA